MAIADRDHYQHTTKPNVPPPWPFRAGDFATVQVIDADPYILQFQRQVRIERSAGLIGGVEHFMVRLESTSPEKAVQGPIPATRLMPGWVEQDGTRRYDEQGRSVRR